MFLLLSSGQYTLFDHPHKIHHKSKRPILIQPFPTGVSQTHTEKQTSPLNSDPDAASDQDCNKLWLIVRYMTVDGKTNQFKLTGGETIKLGRVKFTVKEIQTAEDENKTDFDSQEEDEERHVENASINQLQLDAGLSMLPEERRHFLSVDEELKAENLGKDGIEEAKAERGVLRRKHLINEDTLVCLNQDHNLYGSKDGVFLGDSLEFQLRNASLAEDDD